MCELAVSSKNWIVVDKSFQTGQKLLSYIEENLNNQFEGEQLISAFYVCGSDVLERVLSFISYHQIVCVNREGYSESVKRLLKISSKVERKRIFIVDEQEEKMSSTTIRKKLIKHDPEVGKLLNPSVYQYLENHSIVNQLY